MKIQSTILLLAVLLFGCHGVRRDELQSPLRVAVISDLNSAYGSTTYEPEVHTAVRVITDEWRPDLVLIAGDMVAGQRPALSDDNVRAMWAAFDSTVAAPLRRAGIPLLVTLGNHDASGHPGHERDRRIAREYLGDAAFPTSTLSLGSVFFLSIDASTGNVAADSAQLAWLRGTLASAEARAARMRIVLGHVPLYAVAEGRNRAGEVQAEPDSLRTLLTRAGVDLFVSGHHHAYYPGQRDELALLHAGALGQTPRPLIGSSAEPYKAMTLLELFPARDSVAEQTWRVDGNRLTQVDRATLPARIDGLNGFVLRR